MQVGMPIVITGRLLYREICCLPSHNRHLTQCRSAPRQYTLCQDLQWIRLYIVNRLTHYYAPLPPLYRSYWQQSRQVSVWLKIVLIFLGHSPNILPTGVSVSKAVSSSLNDYWRVGKSTNRQGRISIQQTIRIPRFLTNSFLHSLIFLLTRFLYWHASVQDDREESYAVAYSSASPRHTHRLWCIRDTPLNSSRS